MSRRKGPTASKPQVQDFDPEDGSIHAAHDQSSDEDSDGEVGAREHYETVGTSRLRKPAPPPLDSKYGGSAVSRAAIQRDNNEDPFAPVDEDDEDDPFAVNNESDHPSTSSRSSDYEKDGLTNGAERVSERDTGSQKEAVLGEASDLDARSEDSETSADIGDEDVDDDQSDPSASSTTTPPPRSRPASRRHQLKSLGMAGSSSATASLSAAASADVTKGIAVKQQQSAYDRLLDARIKLQKGLAVSKNLATHAFTDEESQDAVRKAEVAAMSLWSTIDSIRSSLEPKGGSAAGSALKRKQPLDPTPASSSSSLWSHASSLEVILLPHRRTVLNRWSANTRAAAPSTAAEPQLTSVLDSYVSTEASKIVSESKASDERLDYTDDTFYQSLLRDLIASRTQTTSSATASTILSTKLHPSGSSKKSVDTRASKGRRIRYTVHERLQNFMAPEDRSTWSESARREFLGSLFGQRLLDEDGVNLVNGDQKEADHEEAGLRLFRT